jgi:hypothetical protein
MSSYVPSYSFKNPVYKPAMRVIAGITNAPVATVTTTVNHGYIIGTIVRLDIASTGGMLQANQQVGTILTVPTPTTFTININTTYYDVFTVPSGFPPAYNDSQVVPIGEDNSILTAAVVNALNPT